MIMNKVKNTIFDYMAINGRVIYISLQFIFVNVYAPTEKTEDRIKEEFYKDR